MTSLGLLHPAFDSAVIVPLIALGRTFNNKNQGKTLVFF